MEFPVNAECNNSMLPSGWFNSLVLLAFWLGNAPKYEQH
jgi:hypothetical protein